MGMTRVTRPINVGASVCNHGVVAKMANSLTFPTATHPIIFTKRSTSIISCGEEIYPHTDFTDTLDYEGEVGVIVGKCGFQIAEKDAMDYVWGYTIINGKS